MEFQQPVKIRGEIAGGGLGQLLRCLDAAGRKFVAKFPKDFSPQNQAMVTDEERRLRRWQGQNIVRYLGTVHHTDGRTGYAMEEMDESLACVIARRGALSEVTALESLRGAAAGLLEVHRSGPGAFHGDVKPGNILVRGGVAKLADFGLARGGHGQTMMAGPHEGGTPGYFPPEGRASAAGDVYSLGATLAALLVGSEAGPTGPTLPRASSETTALLTAMLEPEARRRISIEGVMERLPSAINAAKARRANVIANVVGGLAIVLGVVILVPLVVASIFRSR